MQKIDLVRFDVNKKGIIIDILGGWGMKEKLEKLGIRMGSEVVKISSNILRGPVVIEVGHTKVAIGYGMAKKIIVKEKHNF